jgi:hypothetical protein
MAGRFTDSPVGWRFVIAHLKTAGLDEYKLNPRESLIVNCACTLHIKKTRKKDDKDRV